jgi:uncharacterized protein
MTILAAVILAAAATAPAEEKAPERNVPPAARVRELLEVTGAAQTSLMVTDHLLASFKQLMPQVPPEVWTEARLLFDAEEMLALVVPVYQKHLSAEDVEAGIAFWKTEAGRRFKTAQPSILSESMAIGEAWGRKMAKDLLDRLKERGFTPPGAPQG